MRPLITLTTDFGSVDHYVGTMKGVILSIGPEIQMVDISHNIPPFSLWSAAYTIDQAASEYPPQTVHVVVVDPGVGTSRKGIVVEVGGHVFVAPDNGVLSLVLARNSSWRAFEITNARLMRKQVSATFHGRDIFAPVAAHLASGRANPSSVGPGAHDLVLLPHTSPLQLGPGLWQGTVLSTDRFGNVVTNFQPELIHGRTFELRIDRHPVIDQLRRNFAEAGPGETFAYVGSSGYLEIGMNQASAATELQSKPGNLLQLVLSGSS